ncbi:MAG: PEP-CTERM sorting domain-containing protein [Planctomycetales bacterium]|nr:PEP-CTERM sorting domain-containing protein [Planctomycetales bacterium]
MKASWLKYSVVLACALMLSSASTARSELVGLWRFDQDVSPQPDSSGMGGAATPMNDAKWVNDPERGGVYEFDGLEDYLEVEDSDPLSVEGALTIVAWAKFNQFDTWNGIVSKTGLPELTNHNRPAPYDLYTMQNGEGWLQAYFGNGAAEISAVRSDLPPDVEVWQHIAVTLTEDLEVTHYLNGEFNGVGFATQPLIDLDTNLLIGSRADSVTNMDGWLDDVAIFNEALTEDQILQVMSGDFSPWLGDVGAPGDYNSDGALGLADYELIAASLRTGNPEAKYDANGDGSVNDADRAYWVTDLKKTWVGDANFDGEFNSGDFVHVFSRGEYEDGVAQNSGWDDGDWNNDLEFDSSDFVAAFQGGGYEQGVRGAISAVPEPASLALFATGLALLWRRRR